MADRGLNNKEKADNLLRELQNRFNSMYSWRELGDMEQVEKLSEEVLGIRKEILKLVTS